MEIRNDFWLRHSGQITTSSKYVCGLSFLSSNSEEDNEIEVLYFTSKKSFPGDRDVEERILVTGGEYLKFDYFGSVKKFHSFINDINKYYLPKLKAIRRKCFDVEIYHLSHRDKISLFSSVTHCSYLIPCANADQLNLLREGGYSVILPSGKKSIYS